MSRLTFAANGSIIKNNRTIESMADTKPLDYFNLAGNLKLAGSIRATNFIKEDGTALESVTVNKLALPENVYYLNKRVGINEENPQADFDVKGTTRLQGGLTGSDALFAGSFISQGPGTFRGPVTVEGEFVANKDAGVRGNFGVGGNFGIKGTSTFAGPVTAESEFVANKDAGVRGNFGVGGNFGIQGTSTFAGPVTAEGEFVANKDAGVRGNFGVGGNFGTQGTNTFKGPMTVEGEFVANKDAGVRGNFGVAGNFGTQGTATFKGPVIASEDITATRHLIASGNASVAGDIHFNGANKWIIHTPDDDRRIMYMAPGNDKGEWMWDKQTMFLNNGNIQSTGAIVVGNAASDANGEQIVIGKTNESNLRLGRHGDYSWIQSHAGKPLKINPLGNDICLQDVCFNKDDLKNIKSSYGSKGSILVKVFGDGFSPATLTITSDSVSDNMDILALSGIGVKNNSKASVYFNIKLKDGAQPGKFTVTSDDGIAFEYSNNNYLISGWENNINDSITRDTRGWKSQGDTPYDYTIPNVSYNGIIKCRLAWFNGGGGSTFRITGLKTAIAAVGTLV
jgi:hypothetical protein